jgi:di/tricarboxylate transporter
MSTYKDEDTIVLTEQESKAIVATCIACVFLAMAFEIGSPEVVFLIALVVVMMCGILTLKECLAGFSNESMITIGALFIVIGAVEKSHLIDYFAKIGFGVKSSKFMGTIRMYLVTFFSSAFFNNTPLVAVFIPVVRDWARSKNIPISQLLIPLSYSVLSGGLLTMIGTSTNLTVQGLVKEDKDYEFNFFAPFPIAIVCGTCTLIYMAIAAPYILPKHTGMFREARDKADQLMAEVLVSKESVFIGKDLATMFGKLGISLTNAIKIRRLHKNSGKPVIVSLESSNENIIEEGIEMSSDGKFQKVPTENEESAIVDSRYVTEHAADWGMNINTDIESSQNECIDIINPSIDEIVCEGDVIFIACAHDVITKLLKSLHLDNKGLSVLHSSVMDLPGYGSELVELVLSPECRFIGQSVGNCLKEFQDTYNVGIVSTRKRIVPDMSSVLMTYDEKKDDPIDEKQPEDDNNTNGIITQSLLAHETKKMILHVGDVLLCLTKQDHIDELKGNHEFIVVSSVGSVPKPITIRGIIPVVIFLVMIALVASEKINMCPASLCVAAIFFAGKWVKASEIPKLVDVRLLMLMACSISFAKSMEKSGIAADLANAIKNTNASPRGALFLVYVITLLMTELISNNAAAAIMYPFSVALAEEFNVSYKPFVMAIMIAATAAFMSPIGYQTHVMVWGPGGYKFIDYVKFGAAINIIWWVGTCLIVPALYPF